eukprot:scaffold38195_cov64-Phaeocystis_antarctica.AAC.2
MALLTMALPGRSSALSRASGALVAPTNATVGPPPAAPACVASSSSSSWESSCFPTRPMAPRLPARPGRAGTARARAHAQRAMPERAPRHPPGKLASR